MSFDPAILLRELDDLAEVAGPPERFVVAFSGGLDSTAMTHALVAGRARDGIPIVAVYVDHGLQRDSAAWVGHCRDFARRQDIDFMDLRVVVDTQAGLGLEAAAREARYAALRNVLQAGDWLLSAHHRDDQAETVLLNLMRGSGPAGLAGIGRVRKFAAGWLVRPLLDVPRSALRDYAAQHALQSIADPSNVDQQFDRNYLRHEVLPRLEARWPNAARRIRRSATLAGDAAGLLAELAAADASRLGDRPDRLAISGLRELSVPRQRNVLRHVVADLGLPMPGAVHVEQIVSELIAARDDAQPLVAWPGARARRYRDRLYLLPADDLEPPPPKTQAFDGNHLMLPGGLGQLVLEPNAVSGLAPALVERGLQIRYRSGGEKFQPSDQSHTRKLKKLLQEEGVVPWMREKIPLLYAGDELVAVGDLWLAKNAAESPGTAIRWQNRPPIH